MPDVPPGMLAACPRCGAGVAFHPAAGGSNQAAAAIAAAALILYPLAVTLPVMSVARMGHTTSASVLSGVSALFADGQLFVAIVVLLCSVVIPLLKLGTLLTLASAAGRRWLAHHHKAFMFRLVEWTGRWGMLDVLLVAILVAALKLGDMVEVRAGPGALAFTVCVLLSLAATACFDPRRLWEPADE